MTYTSTAVLAAAVAVIVALLTQRSAARIAADNRSWDRRANLRRLQRYRGARARVVDHLEDARRVTRLFLSMRLVQLQIRAELGSPMRLSDRLAFAVAGSPVVGFALAVIMSRFVQRRWADEVLLPPLDAAES